MVQSEYLTEVFDPFKFPEVLRRVRMKLRNTKYDAIAFRGMSGAAVAFPLAAMTNKGLICVRKQGVAHSSQLVEGLIGDEIKRYVIVDDFINSGHTLKNIKKSIDEEYSSDGSSIPECVAIVFYKEYRSERAKDKARKVYPNVKVHVIDRIDYMTEND